MFRSSREQVEHRHAHGHSVGDLIENHRERPVGHLGRDLHAAVHRTGVHDDHIGPGTGDAGLGHAECSEVLAQRRKEAALHPFELDPQHHDDVGVPYGSVDVRGDVHAQAIEPGRDERGRAADPDFGTQPRQQQQVRAQHAAVQQVAEDRHLESGDAAFALTNGEGVEQCLSRMLVHAVASVDDAGTADARQQVAGARGAVAQDDHARGHRLDVHGGVDQGLTFDHAGGPDGDIEGVRAQPLLRDLERRARARARFEEQVDDGSAPQRRHFLDLALANFLHRLGGVENQHDLVGRKVGDAEQVLLAQRGERPRIVVNSVHQLTPLAAPALRRRRRSHGGGPGRFRVARWGCSCRRSQP
jgi:hypothetical protein